jgi:hypothetical protein
MYQGRSHLGQTVFSGLECLITILDEVEAVKKRYVRNAPLVGNASFRVPDKATPAMVHGCSPSDANYPFCSQQPLYQAIFSKESVIPVPPN